MTMITLLVVSLVASLVLGACAPLVGPRAERVAGPDEIERPKFRIEVGQVLIYLAEQEIKVTPAGARTEITRASGRIGYRALSKNAEGLVVVHTTLDGRLMNTGLLDPLTGEVVKVDVASSDPEAARVASRFGRWRPFWERMPWKTLTRERPERGKVLLRELVPLEAVSSGTMQGTAASSEGEMVVTFVGHFRTGGVRAVAIQTEIANFLTTPTALLEPNTRVTLVLDHVSAKGIEYYAADNGMPLSTVQTLRMEGIASGRRMVMEKTVVTRLVK